MSYEFPPDVDEQIRQRLASGRYGSEDDVVREAFEALRAQEELQLFRQSIAVAREQVARGDAQPLDVDAVMKRVHQRISESER